jgi:hypothetical protein
MQATCYTDRYMGLFSVISASQGMVATSSGDVQDDCRVTVVCVCSRIFLNDNNNLEGGERSIPVASPPPLAPAKAFSRSGCGRIFSLYSRVMREGLSTGPCADRPGGGLSVQIFSGPHESVDLVQSL